MFSNSWRIFSVIFFTVFLLVLAAIYYFAPQVWVKIWQYHPGSPYVNLP